ncbi:MAG TPA: hypothetical protein VMU26_03630 [Candidatus Polarisedimenticolia bacterium]|nr:hypothetical protein [Candidatus Polarisedimenticolia bacterium]
MAVNMRPAGFCILLLAFQCVPGRANASVAVLLEEPYSYDGALAGTGHTAVYLTRVCAASPTSLRRCDKGEHGVVISRYARIAGYDWIAIPLIPYLYAITEPKDIPVYANREIAAYLKDRYRRERLQELAPDASSGKAPVGDWAQLVGSAYSRTSFAYEIETTAQQDDELILWLNSRPNRTSYRLLSRNCADFVRDVVNFYYPKAVSRGIVADFGITTPKRVARSIVKYSRRHPDLEFVSLVIPQVPGTIRRSRPVRGIAESVLKAKKYVIPLAFFQPYVAGSFAAAYLVDGQFKPNKNAMGFNPRFVDASVAVNQSGSEVSMTDKSYVLALSE